MTRRRQQRGAMFGMDARIALFIFGILSAVTGFVLLQRAGEAHNIRLYANIKDIEAGLKLLARDMGVLPAHAQTAGIGGTSTDQFSMLCDSSFVAAGFVNRWKGPYLAPRTSCTDDSYKTLAISYRLIYATAENVTSVTPPGNVLNNCTVNSSCYAWLGIVGLPAEAFAYINHIVDEASGDSIEATPEDSGRVVFAAGNTLWYRTEVHK